MNLFVGTGNLGKDPVLRSTSSGKSVLNLSLAIDRSYTKPDGTRVNETDWVPVVLWGKSAEHQAKYLQKGSRITVKGQLRTRSYEDSSGQNRNTFEIAPDLGGIEWHRNIRSQEEQQVSPTAPEADF